MQTFSFDGEEAQFFKEGDQEGEEDCSKKGSEANAAPIAT